MATRMLVDEFTSRDNSLNALRLILALLVIVSHAPLLVGAGNPYQWADLEIGGWAVAGFFGVSGWLITSSRLNLYFAPFMWRRCLRILPGFWLMLLVTAIVFAPLAAWRAGDPVVWSSAVSYALNNFSLWIFQPEIGGTLLSNPTSVWNLSLWTLFWEMFCYIGVGVLFGLRAARRDPRLLGAVFVIVTCANVLIRTLDVGGLSPALEAGLRLGSFFLAGAALRVYAHKIPVSLPLATASIAAVALLYAFDMVGALGGLPLAYLALFAGITLPLSRVGSRNDISYGIYIYAFPVGQLIVLSGGESMSVFWFTVLNMALVVPLAWGSWMLVERVAIRFKGLIPNRSNDTVPEQAPITARLPDS